MHSFVQSAFLQALGYAITNSLWQVAITWLVYTLISGAFRLNAAAKYRLATAAQFVGFAWFLITLQFYYAQPEYTLSAGSATAQQSIAGNISTQLISWLNKATQVLPYLSLAYLLLMSFLATRWVLGYRQTQVMRKSGLQKMPVDWRLFVKKIAAQLSIKKEIRVFLSTHITTPLTIGFLKPVILIPVASINHLTTEQLEAVLLHELAHIRRYDYLFNMILSVVELMLFFNPFTQLLSRAIQKERENSCDDWVLQFQYNASDYATALLRIASLQQTPAFAMAAAGKKNELLVRIKRMIGQQENRFNYRRQLFAFLMVTGMLCCVAWLSPNAAGNNTKKIIAKNSIVQKKQAQQGYDHPTSANAATTAKGDNPLFNPAYFLPEDVKSAINQEQLLSKDDMNDALEAAQDSISMIAGAIPDLITGALTAAQKELVEKGLAAVQQAGIPVAPVKMNRLKKQLFDSTQVKQISNGLKLAKKEIVNAIPVAVDEIFNETGLQLQIENALGELNKLDLNNLISTAMKFSDDLSEEDKKGLKSLKNLQLSDEQKEQLIKSLKEKQRKHRRKQATEHGEVVITTAQQHSSCRS